MYLVHPRRPEMSMKMVSFDKDKHVCIGRRSGGEPFTDPNFYPEIVKRCGYVLQTTKPDYFKE